MLSDPHKRYKTRHPGITFRVRANGTRHYYVFAQGKQHSVHGGESEALLRQAELRDLVGRGHPVVRPSTKLTTLADEWMATKSRLRETTLADYQADLKNVILPRFGHLKPAQVSVDEIASLVRDLQDDGLSGARIKNILKPLNGLMKFAARRRLITQNPIDLLMPDERPRATSREHYVWSPDDIKRLLAAATAQATKPFAKYDYTCLLTVAIYTGLRISELLALRWEDIDLKDGSLQVRHQLSRKGKLVDPKTAKAVRRVPLALSLVARLKRHKLASAYSKDDDYVFASTTGTALNARNVATRGLRPALESAELGTVEPKLVFHDLRHAFASIMIERGMTSIELAEVMGHRDSRTTERIYIHLFNRQRMDDRVRAAMQSAMDL